MWRATLLMVAVALSSCSVSTGAPEQNSSAPPPTQPPAPSCGSAISNSACVANYCTASGAVRETYNDVTFCHTQGTQDVWLEYSTIALAENQVETRASQILINPGPKDFPASPKEDGPTLCKRLGGADFHMLKAPSGADIRGCYFIDGSALDQPTLLKGRGVLGGTKLLALLTAKPIRPDTCMTPDLPACATACAPAVNDLCGSPCGAGDAGCGVNLAGEQMICKSGRWQCESHSTPGPSSCHISCRWN